MDYTEAEIQLAMIAHSCTREEAISNGYVKSVHDVREAERPVIQLEALRKERNRLLCETDYLAFVDNTLSNEMKEYRQALRDITDHYSSLEEVVWPEKPES